MIRHLKHPVVAAAIAAVVVGLLVFQFTRSDEQANRYTLQPATRGEIHQTVAANGTLNPVTLVAVGTQVSGIVKRLHVDFNDRVKQGQVLLELDDALGRATLRQSEAALASARAALDLARANFARAESLIAKEFIARQEFESSRQQLAAAEAQCKSAEAARDRDRTNLGYTVIRSPVAGVVIDRQVDVGQTVAASFQTPTLFRIAQDLSRMQIDAAFAEADIGAIRVGQSATFHVDAFPNRAFTGTVRMVRLNPGTTQNVVTYDVVVGVNNADLTLLPGMTAYVSITVAGKSDALLVPNAALRFRPALDALPKGSTESGRGKRDNHALAATGTVWRLVGDKLEAVHLTLGITDNLNTEVLAGELKAGDQLVVSDAMAGKAGAPPGGTRMRFF